MREHKLEKIQRLNLSNGEAKFLLERLTIEVDNPRFFSNTIIAYGKVLSNMGLIEKLAYVFEHTKYDCFINDDLLCDCFTHEAKQNIDIFMEIEVSETELYTLRECCTILNDHYNKEIKDAIFKKINKYIAHEYEKAPLLSEKVIRQIEKLEG